MAIVRAVKSGNWSDTTVWNTGALPTSADDVYSNTFTVTIDTSPTVLSISNAATTGVTAGGSFVPTNGITLTCTGGGVIAGTTSCFVSSLTSGQSCSIVGNLFATTSNASGNGAINNSTGTLNITGNCTGGGSNSSAYGVLNNSAGIVNVTGNCFGGSSGQPCAGAANSSTGALNITGTCTGGSQSINNNGAFNNGTGVLTHVGSVQSTGTSSGIGVGVVTQNTILSGPFLTTASGVNPVIAARWFWANSNVTPTYYQIRTANLATIRPLYTADSVGGNPATSNVRSGTIFGPNNELTGTLAVPPAGSVALGVPVDNTTGTAYLTQSDIAAAATTALTAASATTFNQSITTLTTPNSIGERLKNAATVATVSQQISDVFSSRQ